MDSMRSLNSSLPTPKRAPKQSEHMLNAFKAAALSVTNLYRAAASEQAEAHEAGYQNAIEDLLAFLDKENLGLGDGEGWKVRQWATERVQGAPTAFSADSDEDAEEDHPARSSSPIRPSPEVARPTGSARTASPVRSEPAPQAAAESKAAAKLEVPQASAQFTFQAPRTYPSQPEMDVDDSDNGPVNEPNTQKPSVRVKIESRRPANRPPGTPSRSNGRNSTISLGSLGPGAGLKRKNPMDFFDLSAFGGFGNGKEGFGGGKRGRFA